MENRNQRRNREQWQTLAAQFAGSSLSQEQFCQQHGLGEKTFHNWRLRLNREAQSSSFVPVTAHSTALQEHHGDAIMIRSGEV